MSTRRFKLSKPLDETLVLAERKRAAMANPTRSDQAAKDSAKSFPAEERNPLGNSTNPGSKPGITFASQDKLPKLPIPDLESSCKKYINALEPLQNGREHADTKAAVEEFVRAEGPQLQERLKKYATGKSSYIEQFCKFMTCCLGSLLA